MKKIAITGGIGSGKSTVAGIINQLGYPVFSCDEIYKEVIQMPMYIAEVGRLFPACIINEKIDKKILAEIVFSDDENMSALNQIAHPIIMDALLARMNTCTDEYVFAEVPLLFERNFEALFDEIIVVYRNRESRILSISVRDGLSRKEVEQRVDAQFNYDSNDGKERLKKEGAILVENGGSLEALKVQVEKILQKRIM